MKKFKKLYSIMCSWEDIDVEIACLHGLFPKFVYLLSYNISIK